MADKETTETPTTGTEEQETPATPEPVDRLEVEIGGETVTITKDDLVKHILPYAQKGYQESKEVEEKEVEEKEVETTDTEDNTEVMKELRKLPLLSTCILRMPIPIHKLMGTMSCQVNRIISWGTIRMSGKLIFQTIAA